jgi:hypothetical protein
MIIICCKDGTIAKIFKRLEHTNNLRATTHTRPQLSKTYGENSYVLEANDSRYTLRFPIEAVEANPNIEKWEDGNFSVESAESAEEFKKPGCVKTGQT